MKVSFPGFGSAVLPFAGHDGRAARRIGAALAEDLAVELLRLGGIDLRAGP